MYGLEIECLDDRVRLIGELDAATAPAVQAALEPFGEQAVTIDLAGVTFVDSSGMRALIVARRRHPALRIVGAQTAARRVFEIAGVTEHILGN